MIFKRLKEFLLITLSALPCLSSDLYLGNSPIGAPINKGEGVTIEYTVHPQHFKIFNQQVHPILIYEQGSQESFVLYMKRKSKTSAILFTEIPKNQIENDSNIKIYSLKNFNGNKKQALHQLKRDSFDTHSLILNRSANKVAVELFDTPDEALANYNFKQQFEQTTPVSSPALIQPLLNVDNRQTGQVSARPLPDNLMDSFLTEINQNGAYEDIQQELIKEKKRRLQLKSAARQWSKSKKQDHKEQAKKIVAEAFLQTKNQHYDVAKLKFLKASDLAPQSELLYQHYGLSLHRAGQYKMSKVVLSLVHTNDKLKSINSYYLGMNAFKVKDWQTAQQKFNEVIQENSASLKVKAHFYTGLSLQALEEYDKAAKYFQFVLDNSKDSKMDNLAEKYLEDGLRKKSLKKKNSKRFFYTGVLGLFYDSNIVLAIDGTANQQTDQEGTRFLSSNQFQYRFYKSEQNAISLRANASLIKSQKNDFSSSSGLEAADPWVFSTDILWNHKQRLWGVPYNFDFSPKYEVISMDLDSTSMQNIIHSTVLDFNNQWVLSNKWIASADLQLRQDDAKEATGTITDDADANKVSLNLGSILVLNKALEKYLIPTVGYVVNDANGDDFNYNRYDFSLTYTQALYGIFAWNSRLGFYQADYKSTRSDKNVSVQTGLGYTLGPQTKLDFNISYQKNDSNTNEYDKFQAITTLGFSF